MDPSLAMGAVGCGYLLRRARAGQHALPSSFSFSPSSTSSFYSSSFCNYACKSLAPQVLSVLLCLKRSNAITWLLSHCRPAAVGHWEPPGCAGRAGVERVERGQGAPPLTVAPLTPVTAVLPGSLFSNNIISSSCSVSSRDDNNFVLQSLNTFLCLLNPADTSYKAFSILSSF